MNHHFLVTSGKVTWTKIKTNTPIITVWKKSLFPSSGERHELSSGHRVAQEGIGSDQLLRYWISFNRDNKTTLSLCRQRCKSLEMWLILQLLHVINSHQSTVREVWEQNYIRRWVVTLSSSSLYYQHVYFVGQLSKHLKLKNIPSCPSLLHLAIVEQNQLVIEYISILTPWPAGFLLLICSCW